MTSWNNKFKTHILDPVLTNASKSVFKLDEDHVYSADLVLSDIVGLSNRNVTQLPVTSGFWSLVDKIYLYNDNEEIASLSNVNEWMGFKNMQFSNDEEYSLQGPSSGSGSGFWTPRANNHGDRVQKSQSNTYNVLNDASGDFNATGNLRMNEALPFLKAVKFLDTRKLRKLRLEIYWRSAISLVNTYPTNGAVSTGTPSPTLTINEVIDEADIDALPKGAFELTYMNMVLESFPIDAVSGDDVLQYTNKRLRGFDGKFLNRMMVANNISAETGGIVNYNAEMKESHSMGFRNEKINFTLNNHQLLPEKGVDTPCNKLAMCNDVWGEMTMPLLSQGQVATYHRSVIDSNSEAYYQASYGGFQVEERINNLEINYERQGNATAYNPDTALNGGSAIGAINVDRTAFQMNVWGEIARVIQWDASGNLSLFE